MNTYNKWMLVSAAIAMLFLFGGLYTAKNGYGKTETSVPESKVVTTEYVYEFDYMMAGSLKELRMILDTRGKNNWELVEVSSTQYTTTLYWKKSKVKISIN